MIAKGAGKVFFCQGVFSADEVFPSNTSAHSADSEDAGGSGKDVGYRSRDRQGGLFFFAQGYPSLYFRALARIARALAVRGKTSVTAQGIGKADFFAQGYPSLYFRALARNARALAVRGKKAEFFVRDEAEPWKSSAHRPCGHGRTIFMVRTK